MFGEKGVEGGDLQRGKFREVKKDLADLKPSSSSPGLMESTNRFRARSGRPIPVKKNLHILLKNIDAFKKGIHSCMSFLKASFNRWKENGK